MDYRQKTIDGRNGGCSLFVLRLFMAAGMFSRAARGMEGGPRSGRAKGAAGARSTGAPNSPTRYRRGAPGQGRVDLRCEM